eukprot:TRINITY_DN483_c0_g3_i1.p1 TRINITY_DN483_c0_g3~~TRINITY_DN483_c0_g3_i1.p1  ORF type:complete len:198 (-),score=40.43 TRINITY_DN483_c0_g3_i1:37-630(-)
MSKKKASKNKNQEEEDDEIDTQKLPPKWRFTSKVTAPEIGITDDGQILTKKENDFHRVALADKRFDSGLHYWDVSILKMVPSEELSIGVASESGYGKLNLEATLGMDKNSWAYCSNGTMYHYSKIAGEGEKFGEGDKIGVLLDCSTGTVRFFKKGIIQKGSIQIRDIHKRLPIVPAVSLHGKNTVVRVNTNAENPLA